MALRNYMYSKHNQDNNINTMIFHKDTSGHTESTARDESKQNEEIQTTETINDEERSKTLVSNEEETKVSLTSSNDEDIRNNSINTLNSTSDIVHNVEPISSTKC